MKNIEKVIERFGGVTKMSRMLGHKHVTTVHAWKRAGRSPKWRIYEIRAAAIYHGIKVSDLFDKEKTNAKSGSGID